MSNYITGVSNFNIFCLVIDFRTMFGRNRSKTASSWPTGVRTMWKCTKSASGSVPPLLTRRDSTLVITRKSRPNDSSVTSRSLFSSQLRTTFTTSTRPPTSQTFTSQTMLKMEFEQLASSCRRCLFSRLGWVFGDVPFDIVAVDREVRPSRVLIWSQNRSIQRRRLVPI